jgi:hypothetical protein
VVLDEKELLEMESALGHEVDSGLGKETHNSRFPNEIGNSLAAENVALSFLFPGKPIKEESHLSKSS